MKLIAQPNLSSLLTFLIGIIFASAPVFAGNNYIGGGIEYECLGNGTYEVKLYLISNDDTSFNPSNMIVASNDCSPYSVNLTVTLASIEQLDNRCPYYNSPDITLYYKAEYSGQITLPNECNEWSLVTNLPGLMATDNSNSLGKVCGISTTINNMNQKCINSPKHNWSRNYQYPKNNSFQIDVSCEAQNGGNIHYEWRDIGNATFYYPFSDTFPMHGISLDTTNGIIYGNSDTIGNYLMGINIYETDNSGEILAACSFIFNIDVVNYSNNPPKPTNGILLSNFSTNISQIDSSSIRFCKGSNVSFDINLYDADTSDILTYISNINTVLPGAVITDQYNHLSHDLTIHVAWNAPQNFEGNYAIKLSAEDAGCRIKHIQDFRIFIIIDGDVNIQSSIVDSNNIFGFDYFDTDTIKICSDQEILALVKNGTSLSWNMLSGEPISLGLNFSCNNCDSVYISPSISSSYEVQAANALCSYKDTIHIIRLPDFDISIDMEDTLLCYNSVTTISLSATNDSIIQFNWSPGYNFEVFNSLSTSIECTNSGTFVESAYATSSNGCKRLINTSYTVQTSVAPNFNLSSNIISGVCDDSIIINSHLGIFDSSSELIEPSSLANNPQVFKVGNSQYNFEAGAGPFNGPTMNFTYQMIYTKAELNNVGFFGGEIDGVSFEITEINTTSPYINFGVHIGATNLSNFDSTLQMIDSMHQVYAASQFMPQAGQNYFEFDSAFVWNGSGNLIIQLCRQGTNPTTFGGPFNPVIHTLTDHKQTLFSTYNCTPLINGVNSTHQYYRPDITFYGQNYLDSSHLSLNWSSSSNSYTDMGAFISDQPFQSSTYTLNVVDTATGCHASNSIYVELLCDTCLHSSINVEQISCFNWMDGEISVIPNSLNGPPFEVQLLEPNTYNLLSSFSGVNQNLTISNLDTTTIIVRTIDTLGCWSDSLVQISNPLPINLTLSQDTIICEGDSTLISATTENPNTIVLWSFTSDNSADQWYSLPYSSNVFVEAQLASNPGCYDIESVQIDVQELAEIEAFTASTSVPIGYDIDFYNVGSSANDGYLWDFGDGITSSIENPLHTFTAQGEYDVILYGYQNGCLSTDTVHISAGYLSINTDEMINLNYWYHNNSIYLDLTEYPDESITLDIISIEGKLTERLFIQNNRHITKIVLSHISKGVYLLKFKGDKENQISSEKFIKY